MIKLLSLICKILIKNSNQNVKNYLNKNNKIFLNEQKKFGKGLKLFYSNLYKYLKTGSNLMNKISSNEDVLSSYKNLDKISSKMRYINII